MMPTAPASRLLRRPRRDDQAPGRRHGGVTPVTLTFAANDSWNNDVDLSTNTTVNAKMMKGVIKQQNAEHVCDLHVQQCP